MSNPEHFDSRLNNAIAHWQVDPQTWAAFMEFDKAQRNKQDQRTLLVILLAIVLLLCVFFLLGVVEAVIAIVILAAVFSVVAIIHFVLQGHRYRQMESRGGPGYGDVYITPAGISANGVWFDWGDNTPWKLVTVTPALADSGIRLPPGVPSYLEFKCRARAAGRHRAQIDKTWRVPVPRGKESEAREVVEYFGRPSGRLNEYGLPED